MSELHSRTVLKDIQQAELNCPRQQLGMVMFDGFFAQYPEARQLYADTHLPDFSARKFKAVSELILDSVRNPEYATCQMVSEVLRHEYFEARDVEYFYAMAEHCRQAIQQALSDEWNEEREQIWDEALSATKAVIQQAVHEAT